MSEAKVVIYIIGTHIQKRSMKCVAWSNCSWNNRNAFVYYLHHKFEQDSITNINNKNKKEAHVWWGGS